MADQNRNLPVRATARATLRVITETVNDAECEVHDAPPPSAGAGHNSGTPTTPPVGPWWSRMKWRSVFGAVPIVFALLIWFSVDQGTSGVDWSHVIPILMWVGGIGFALLTLYYLKRKKLGGWATLIGAGLVVGFLVWSNAHRDKGPEPLTAAPIVTDIMATREGVDFVPLDPWHRSFSFFKTRDVTVEMKYRRYDGPVETLMLNRGPNFITMPQGIIVWAHFTALDTSEVMIHIVEGMDPTRSVQHRRGD